ncbi:unnamed protein product [Ectocarpus sp. 8 AP-2014]
MLPPDMEEAPEAHLMEGTPGTQLVEATRQRVQRGRRTETPARRAAVVHPEMAEATEMQLMKKARRIPSRQRGGQPTRRKVEHRRPRSQGRSTAARPVPLSARLDRALGSAADRQRSLCISGGGNILSCKSRAVLVDSPVFRNVREKEGQTAMSVEYICRTCRTSVMFISAKSCRLEQRLFVRLLSHDLSPARKQHRSCSRSPN